MRGKGGSHVGMILSFVIFITFIVFLYSVVKPAINTGTDKKSILSSLETQVIKNVSSNLTSTTVQINNNPNKNCVVFANLLTALGVQPPYPLIVKNDLEAVQEAYAGSVGAEFGGLKIDNRNKKNNVYDSFFNVYYSTNFNGLTTKDGLNCQILNYDINSNTGDYTIGSVTLTKYAFENKINYLKDYYTANYDQLKTYLKIPPGNEFGFGFVKSDGTKTEVGTAPEKASVYADEIPVQYVDANANILSGFINLKVW